MAKPAITPEQAERLEATLKEVESLSKKFAANAADVGANMHTVNANMTEIFKLEKNLTAEAKKEKKFREDVNDLTKEILQNVQNIGSEEFKTFDVSTKLAKARRMNDKNLVRQLVHSKQISKEQERQHKLLKEEADLLGKPFKALDSFIKQIPIVGDLLSTALGLDDMAEDMMSSFKEAAAQNLMGKQEVNVTPKVEDIGNLAASADVTPNVEDIGDLAVDVAISGQGAEEAAVKAGETFKQSTYSGMVEGATSGAVEAGRPFKWLAGKIASIFKKDVGGAVAGAVNPEDISKPLASGWNDFQSNVAGGIGLSREDISSAYAGEKAMGNIAKSSKDAAENLDDGTEASGGMFGNINKFRLGMAAAVGLTAMLIMRFKKVSDELGISITQAASMASLINPDAVVAFGKEFGTVENLSGLTALNLKWIEFRFGVSADNAAKLSKAMGNISSASTATLVSQIGVYSQMARTAGVSSKIVMEDVANNTELFAKFARDGGDNIMRAAIQAAKLGISLSDVASSAESLLDFETSIEKQLEAEVLLGRSLNLEKARQLSFAGDMEGLQKELVRLVGSENEWNNLNFIQRKAMADALGMSMEKVASIVGAEERLAQAQEQSAKNLWAKMAVWAGIGALTLGVLGAILGGLGILTGGLTWAGWGAMTTGMGIGAALGGGLGATSAAITGTMAQSPPSFQNLEPGKMANIQSGEARAHSGETIVNIEDFNKLTTAVEQMGSKVEKAVKDTAMVAEIQRNKQIRGYADTILS
jgi:hypothetical protein